MNTIVVGKISKPQGIKGEVKIQAYVDAPAGFSCIKSIFVDGKPYKIQRARVVGADVFLTFEGIVDRNMAETLRDKELTVYRTDADPFKNGEFFVTDLIGLRVLVGDLEVGCITEVLQYGSADVLAIKGEKEYMAPYLKRLVLAVDLTLGTMTMDSAVWQEVSCEN